MKTTATVLALLVLASGVWAKESVSMGQWLQYRGDRALTGRSFLKGDITSPKVKWKQFVGARETLLAVDLGGRNSHKVALPKSDLHAEMAGGRLFDQWGIGGPWHDLDESGKYTDFTDNIQLTTVPMYAHYKIGKFLPDVPGLQKLEFDTGFEKCGASGELSVPLCGRLMLRKNGKWEQLWESEPIPMLYIPDPIVGDFDGDGKLEIAVTPWYDVWVLDLETGKTKTKARFTPEGAESGRAYGWFGAYDINRDGKSEFIVIGDLENHIEVLGWENGQLKLLWSRLVERGITFKHSAIRPGVFPVQDVDGDGQLELALSVFDRTGDGKWHIEVLDAMTGKSKLDLADQFLTGTSDVDGDGTAELFCTQTSGLLTPERAKLSIINFKGGKQSILWQTEKSAFQTHEVTNLPLNTNGWNTPTALLAGPTKPNGLPVFFTREVIDMTSGTAKLTAWQWDKSGHISELGTIEGPRIEAVAVREDKGVLVRARTVGDKGLGVELSGGSAKPVVSHKARIPASPAVAGRLSADSAPAVVVQGACEDLVAFHPPSNKHKATTLWRVPGRGMFMGCLHHNGGVPYCGVILADLLGDGSLATVAGTKTPDGFSRLVAVDAKGKEIWHRDFEQYPGAPPVYNVGGMIFWFAGHFRDPSREDVLVTLRRSSIYTEDTLLLDGRTGEEIWTRSKGSQALGAPGRACGGSWMAIYDHDGNGLDDICCMYPDGVFVMNGSTSEPMLDENTNRGVFPEVWSLFGIPAIADFLGNGKLQILYGTSTYALGVLNLDGKAIWADAPLKGTPGILPGIGDADGDGRIEMFGPGWRRTPEGRDQEFHCHDAATGKLKWKLPLPGKGFGNNVQFYPGSPMPPATCDVDSDGRDECIFGINNTLYAISASKNGASGEIKWTLDFPANIGPAAIADADGTGKAQVVVVCEDGYVYGIGK